MPDAPTVAIVGGGCSGTLLAIHLLTHPEGRRDRRRIVMIERSVDVGRGVAYATTCDRHLLNVPAADMSVYPDDPAHFVRWLRRYQPGAGGGSFVRRRLYGEYLRSALREERRRAGGSPSLELVWGQVVDITPRGDRLSLICRDGRCVEADSVVLTPGNFPPRRPTAVGAPAAASGRYVDNPWRRDLLSGISPDATVVLLGSGLTAMDTALSLSSQGHTGPIHAVSRHGQAPEAHRFPPPRPPTAPCPQGLRQAPGSVSVPDSVSVPTASVLLSAPSALSSAPVSPSWPAPVSARGLLHAVRQRAAEAEARGDDWRSAIDGLRGDSNQIWDRLPLVEQRRVLRHLRSCWNIHRHRMAPQAAGWIDSLRAQGQVTVTAGRLEACAVGARGLRVTIRRRPPAATEILDVDYLINCTGPESDVTVLGDPLLDALLARGWAVPGRLGMGVAVSAGGALIDQAGVDSTRLWAIGSLRQGTVWETTAVPELRHQAAALAHQLTATLITTERPAIQWPATELGAPQPSTTRRAPAPSPSRLDDGAYREAV